MFEKMRQKKMTQKIELIYSRFFFCEKNIFENSSLLISGVVLVGEPLHRIGGRNDFVER